MSAPRLTLLAITGQLLVLLLASAVSAQSLDLESIEQAADSVAQALIAEEKAAAFSIAVGHRGEIVFAKGYGLADLELDVPAGPETVFNIASVTKQFTAAAVMQLVEVGKIALDDSITKYLPDYPVQGHHVTIRHLLNHTSGIKSYTGIDSDHWEGKFRLDLSFEEMLELFANEPFDFPPGEDFDYNNSGYYLLGEIIARVTGRSYAAFIEEDVLGPISVESMVICDGRRLVPNLAEGYHHDDGALIKAPYLSLGTFSPATGGLCSTASDLVRWTQHLHDGRVVSSQSFEQMTTPTFVSDGRTFSYGFALDMGGLEGRRKIGHGGSKPGFGAYLTHYPDDDLTVAVLANGTGADADEAEESVARAALGIQLSDIPLTKAEAARYEGNYVLQFGTHTRDLHIFWEGGRLVARLSGDESTQTTPLRNQGDHIFVAQRDPDYRFVFNTGDGPAVTMVGDGNEFPGRRKH